ncbi:MAG: HD domain-containing protein [Bacillota bacterium]
MENIVDSVLDSMIEYYKGDARRIQHFIKVHAFAKAIGKKEGLSDSEQRILEIAAYVHDIGIKKAEELYGSCGGALQEKLGEPIARDMLTKLHIANEEVQRVCYLVGHHHTYSAINGRDYRILVEADFLVNLQEEGSSIDAITSAYNKIFATTHGKYLCRTMFNI